MLSSVGGGRSAVCVHSQLGIRAERIRFDRLRYQRQSSLPQSCDRCSKALHDDGVPEERVFEDAMSGQSMKPARLAQLGDEDEAHLHPLSELQDQAPGGRPPPRGVRRTRLR